MHYLYENQEKLLLESLIKNKLENNKFIFLISGQFGVGKTDLIEKIAERNLSDSFSDIIIKFNHNQQFHFFPDFLKNASISLSEDYNTKNILFDELNYFYDEFYRNFEQIKTLNEEIFNKFINLNKLKSIPELLFSENEPSNVDKEVKSFILSNIGKKGYQRILLNYFDVATESLIMDLLSFFFLSSENSNLKDIQIGGEKKILTIILDNYDRVAGTINNWIFNYLTEYFLNKKFSEFISYTINFENSEFKVGDLFDLNLIIAGRYLNSHFIDKLKPDYQGKSQLIELSKFDESTLKSHLESEFKDLSDRANEIYEYSLGCPSVVYFITKHYSRFKKIPDKNDILNYAIHQIFLYTPEKFRKCVIITAFVERFEKTYFRCFEETKDSFEFCFEYIVQSSDFFNWDKSGNSIEPNAVIAEFMREYIKTNFSHSFENYSFVSSVYKKSYELLKPFSYEETKILRSLAYLDSIELEIMIKEIYQEDFEKVISFIQKNKNLFNEKDNHLLLKAEIKQALDELNKVIDGDNYQMKLDSIESTRKKVIADAQEEKREKTNIIASYDTDIKILEDCLMSDKSNFESTQKSFIDKENELIELRKQLNIFTNNRYYTNSGLNFVFAIFIGLLSYFFPDIFSSPENHSSLFMVQFILYFIVVVFGVLSLYNLYQGLKLASKNRQKFEVNTKLINAEQERANLQEQMTRLKENQELNRNTLNEKKEQLELMKERLNLLNKFIRAEKN